MIVYLVYYEDDDDDCYCPVFKIVDIFDTEEKASAEANRQDEENNTDCFYYTEFEVK